ncbi:MAG TPA: 3-oxoacyl-[acyl-carrier-protein] synthase III C-terminal domain-containing protein [Polyangia bacterium]
MFPLPLKIAGIGRYLPSRVVPSAELEARCGLTPGWIERKTGVRERRWASGDETNSFMGAQAAREAVAAAGLALTDVDLIVNASGSQEQAIPDGGPLIQRQLGLETSGVGCLSVHATCLSFIAAVDVAASFLATGRAHRVLVVSADIGSAGINFAEPESASLIGDAAAALVLTRPAEGEPSRLLAARLETYSAGADLTCIRGGGTRRHPNHAETRPEDNLFHMEGPAVYRMAHQHLGGFLDRVRPGLAHGLGAIALVVPHQASLFAVRSLRKYGMPDDRVMLNVDRLGNCIATSIPSALYDAVQQGRVRRGDEILLLGTGAGLSLGAAILTY